MNNMMRVVSRELIEALENSGIRELAEVLCDTKRLVFRSFVSGLFRGLGAAIGFSVLGAIALLLISRLFGINS
jgi:hypothetical protein